MEDQRRSPDRLKPELQYGPVRYSKSMFDPNIPATSAEATSAMFRGQFNGLKDLIDAVQSVTSVQVDGVDTLNPGENATVDVSFDGTNVHFQFGIPRGNDGGTGNDGQPGEVTNADLSNAIDGTSANTNAVNTLDTAFANDPPTLADIELMRSKYNELVLALRR